MHCQIKSIIVIYIISIIFWISLVVYREYNNIDVEILRYPLITYRDRNFNGWGLLHFLSYISIGYYAKLYWKWPAIIGVMFEGIEYILNKTTSRFIDSKPIEDSIANLSGLFIGYKLSNNNCIPYIT